MREAPRHESPHVHQVELDFIPGKLNHLEESFQGMPLGRQMWGGFALAVLRPEPRVGDVLLLASGER